MSKQTRVSHPIYSLLPTEVEGFDSLAELALDMRWSWNHATDGVWRTLDPVLWELTQNPWVVLQTEAVIDDVMPLPRMDIHMETSDSIQPTIWETTLTNEISGYLRFVDLKQLLSLATSHRVKVQVARRVGQFVPAGTPLLLLNKGDRLSAGLAAALRGAFDFGPTRTLQQDVEFGILQIVDIALKAISPAVNDPTTAVGCVDQLNRIMIRVASRETPEVRLYDLGGVARVRIQWIDFEHLLDSAFEQIRMYSKRALGDVSSTCRETGAPMKVQQELMRHADIRTTMNVYGKAMDESKREAHGKVVRLVLPSKVA